MASSFVDSIIQSMSSGLVSRLSTTLGEPTSNIETGLSTAIRAISASVATRANDPEVMGHIHSMALDPENDLSLPGRTEGMLSRLTSGSGGNTSWDFIQSLLLGNRMSNMSDSLASYAGVSSATAKSLFAMAMPLVMSYLGKMIRTDHLDTSVCPIGSPPSGDRSSPGCRRRCRSSTPQRVTSRRRFRRVQRLPATLPQARSGHSERP